MYHELSKQEKKTRRKRRLFALLLALLLVVVCWYTYDIVTDNLRAQGELSMRNSVLNSAKQCFAIEGAYPSSVYYLEQNYGLVINHSNYLVTYEVFAENVLPSVVVISR